MTIKAFPSTEFHVVLAFLGTAPGSEKYRDVVTALASSIPALDTIGISAYTFTAPNLDGTPYDIHFPIDGYFGQFMLPALDATKTGAFLNDTITKLFETAVGADPNGTYFSSVSVTTYPDFWAYYKVNNGPLGANDNNILGGRLLDEKSLTGNKTALKEALKVYASSPGSPA